MPFSDPLCAQYSLSVIKNLSRGNRRFFRVVGRTKGKIFLCKFIISNGAPFVNTMPPPPLRGRPPSPIRETPRSREPHIRESHTFARATHSREPHIRESHTFAGDLRPSCLFWGARSPSVTPRVRRLRDNSDPFRGRPPSPIRETPRSREPHIRGRPPSLVSFLVARDPPRSHAGCATETTQIRKPARIGPQAFPKASPKPQKALRQAPKALRQATSPKCTENPPKNRIIFAKDPSIKNHPRKSPRG